MRWISLTTNSLGLFEEEDDWFCVIATHISLTARSLLENHYIVSVYIMS